MKKIMLSLFLCGIFLFSGCGNIQNPAVVPKAKSEADHIGTEEKEEFILSEDLKAAILPLALEFDSFDNGEVHKKEWKEFFINGYLLNSRNSYDYLDQISGKNDGRVSVKDIEYIQESLTGEKLDFSDYPDINTKNASSFLSAGEITDHTYEKLSNGNIRLNADLEKTYDGSAVPVSCSLSVTLSENPQSCFGGDSIRKLTCKELPSAPVSSKEKTFTGIVYEESDWTDENTCTVEYSYDEEGLGYAHFVYLDVSGDSKLKEKLKKLAGEEVTISYTEGRKEHQLITSVIPIEVKRK